MGSSALCSTPVAAETQNDRNCRPAAMYPSILRILRAPRTTWNVRQTKIYWRAVHRPAELAAARQTKHRLAG